MVTLIKIDRKSIVKNKNHGATCSRVYAGSVTYIELKNMRPKIFEKYLLKIESYNQNQFNCYYTIDNLENQPHEVKDKFNELIDMGHYFSVELKNNYHDFFHEPITKYNYTYEDVDKLKCEVCGHSLDWCYDDEDYRTLICSKCNDIIDYEYESLTDNELDAIYQNKAVARLKGEVEAIETAQIKKGCKE